MKLLLTTNASLDDPSRVINIGSIDGLNVPALPTFSYSASKAAVHHLTRVLAAQLVKENILVNAIAPGPVDTAMAKKVHTADIRSDYHDVIPLNRYGLEEEIADAVWFLCSDFASYING